MNAAAPQAPVAENGTIDTARTETGRNRKSRRGERSAALEKGAAKGSAEFQQLLAARAARQAGAAGRSHAAETAAAEETAGLKKALAALLKDQSKAHRLPLPSSQGEQAQAASRPHEDPSRRQAPSRLLHGLALAAAFGQPDHSRGTTAASKEQKGTAETEKAAAGEARPAAHRAEPLVRVVDLRRHEKPSAASDGSADRKPDPTIIADRDSTGASARIGQTRVTITGPNGGAAPAQAPAAHPAPLDRLRDMAGSELLRASTMVLRDGGGEIRLVLKPESLGSVRVRMNLVDNHIEGRIIVDSAAVKHVFDGSVDALRRALTAEGFQMGSLQVSVGGQDAQADQGRRDRQVPEAVRRVTAQGFERNVPGVEDVSLGDLFVNLFV